MVFLIRAMFGKALKTNDALAFAVLTGCLRVSKESIFTGLNNFKILSITDTRFDEQFGFTDAEVQKLLSDYHLENRFRDSPRPASVLSRRAPLTERYTRRVQAP